MGFRLKAQGKADLAISYLRGDLAAATLPELQLSDEGVIERLCFESRSFEMLETSAQGIPDLAAELKARMKIKATPKKTGRAQEAAAETAAADDEIPFWMWGVLVLSVFMLGGGGAAWFFLLRGDDDEDDEEDEEEDDDEE